MNPSACHDPVNALLPWYVNGSLGEDEESRARAHIETCPICSDELDHLTEFARALPAHQAPAGPAAARPSRLPLLAAASLLLPAILGISWAILGFPMVRRSAVAPSQGGAAARLQATATLDLGAGPMRGVGTTPSVVLEPGVERLATTLVLPVVPDSALGIELQDAGGNVLAREDRVRPSDDRLRCTYSLAVDVFPASGEYAIVLRESVPGGAKRTYRFPFVVTISSPRG